MTDKEIIKALECCVKAPYCSKKTDCPYKGIDDCVKKHTLDALDLINRQQAEIEEYKRIAEYQQSLNVKRHFKLKEKEAEIERLEKLAKDRADVNFEKIVGVVDRASADIKAEAIKEFAERLKESSIDVDVSFGYGREVYTEAVPVVEIDNLVKEMVGDNNAE